MDFTEVLVGKKITLRCIKLSDCTENYVKWLSNEKVNQFLETRHSEQNIDSVKKFVEDVLVSGHSYLFAIIENFSKKHIGNIKIGPVHSIYKNADISYFIGEESAHGKGYATEAIRLVAEFSFLNLKLHRLQASFFSSNVASKRCLEKNGFIQEGVLRKKVLNKYDYEDIVVVGLLKTEFE